MGEFASFDSPSSTTPPPFLSRSATNGRKQAYCRVDPEHQEQGLSFTWRARSVRLTSDKKKGGQRNVAVPKSQKLCSTQGMNYTTSLHGRAFKGSVHR